MPSALQPTLPAMVQTDPAEASASGSASRARDAALIERAVRGDRDAWKGIVDAHQNAVFRLLRRLLVGRQGSAEIEDLAQETFLRVHRALPRFEPGGNASFRGWLLTIATRLALDRLRKRELPRAPAGVVAIAPDCADARHRRRQLAERIAAAVGELPDEHRAAFVLREYHAMEYDEIARALNISVGTVGSRLSRARAALRAALEDCLDD